MSGKGQIKYVDKTQAYIGKNQSFCTCRICADISQMRQQHKMTVLQSNT